MGGKYRRKRKYFLFHDSDRVENPIANYLKLAQNLVLQQYFENSIQFYSLIQKVQHANLSDHFSSGTYKF